MLKDYCLVSSSQRIKYTTELSHPKFDSLLLADGKMELENQSFYGKNKKIIWSISFGIFLLIGGLFVIPKIINN